MLIADEPWICPQCGYEWVDPKDEWVNSESCELCLQEKKINDAVLIKRRKTDAN